ncbi:MULTISPECIES: hypothetical protein [unclassified Brenneria]|uniref:hypothetical protein n=1 Tax=unclassified Brenneria TaxID=2634434 RepID=UPI0029C4D966|nr:MULTISPECIES: hypothetical protein [unclassified Brenneria]MDX5629304.1 hypothetical protein [Brenneria sp. L3-3Z]MDX5696533.1 hypothetical protein [Brenneria sp. L4-2C]
MLFGEVIDINAADECIIMTLILLYMQPAFGARLTDIQYADGAWLTTKRFDKNDNE